MSLLYADTSALARAYFVDEPDHATLRSTLLEGTEPLVTSELARVELASAVTAAVGGGRLRAAEASSRPWTPIAGATVPCRC